MTKRNRITFSFAAMLSLTVAASSFTSSMAVVADGANSPISADEVRTQARVELNNAISAGRLSKDDGAKFSSALDVASSVSDVERTWAELETAAQQAKEKHNTIENLLSEFTTKVNQLQKQGIVSPESMVVYRDRLKSIERLKKQFKGEENFYDFWEYVVLGLDFSSLQERLDRALAHRRPPVETMDHLIMRTDNYLLRNEVAARGLTVYKSFEVEPEDLLAARNAFVAILTDKATSNLKTPKVSEMLYRRLLNLHYEPYHQFPSEVDIDKAILEVERLLDSGARNGNLSALDDIRIRHELDLVKEVKKAWPGVKPGIDPVERELRLEEVRFMCMDLRTMQNWLQRSLRKDGDNDEAREELVRLLHRIDLAYFSHRITKQDVASLLTAVDEALRKSANGAELATKCRELEGRMDMMVSDFSMSPAQITPRLNEINRLITMLKIDQSSATRERDRIQQYLSGYEQLEPAKKYGVSIVAAAELEMLRKRINAQLKVQGAS